MKILSIDDEENVRQSLKRVLEKEGHTVAEASDVKEGMDKQVDTTFDLIILDLKMPKIDEQEIIDLLRMRFAELPIFILSGYIKSKDELTNLGATRVFEKPVDMNILLEAIKEIDN